MPNNDQHAPLGWSLDRRNPNTIRSLMSIWEWLYQSYFRVQTSGWQHIPTQGQVLLVGSHNGGLAAPDMFMMMYDWFRRFGIERPTYGLMHPHVWQAIPAVAEVAEQCGAVVAHPKMAIAALKRGASVLVYPGGAKDVFRPHALRNKIFLNGNQAFVRLAIAHQVPVVPAISYGAHDTLIVLTDAYRYARKIHEEWGIPWFLDLDPQVFPIYLGIPWGLAIGPLPNLPFPVQIHTRICPPIEFEWTGHKAARDREYVNECYNLVCAHMQQELNDLVQTVEQRRP